MISRLSAYKPEQMCSKCGEMYSRDVNHFIFDCPYFEMLRKSFNEKICRICGETVFGNK